MALKLYNNYDACLFIYTHIDSLELMYSNSHSFHNLWCCFPLECSLCYRCRWPQCPDPVLSRCMRLFHCSGQGETGTQLEGDCGWNAIHAELLTQVSTEGHFSSSSWYSTAVGSSWSEGVVSLSTSQSDELGSIPYHVEQISSSC